MKKLLIILAILIALALGWYFVSPLFINETVDEEFPVPFSEDIVNPPGTNDPDPIVNSAVNEPTSALDPHDLTQKEIDAMSEDEKMEMERKIVEELADQPIEVMEDMMKSELEEVQTKPFLISEGQFENADDFHQGSGRAGIYQFPDGLKFLRFENFEVTNGPDLRVYLVESENPTKAQVKEGLELAELKGNKGNQNYELPEGTDASKYKSVVIYCKPFSVIFSVAGLG